MRSRNDVLCFGLGTYGFEHSGYCESLNNVDRVRNNHVSVATMEFDPNKEWMRSSSMVESWLTPVHRAAVSLDM